MNIIIHNRRELEFNLADLDIVIKDYIQEAGTIKYLIEVKLSSQIWIIKRRFNDFDKMHKRLSADLEHRASDNLPELPVKRMFFNKEQEFIKERLKYLNKYLKFMILIYEAIENPILQRFLEIDSRYNPNNEYEPIDIEKNHVERSESDESSLYLEMDKYMKNRFKYLLRNKTGPDGTKKQQNNIQLIQELQQIQNQLKINQNALKDLESESYASQNKHREQIINLHQVIQKLEENSATIMKTLPLSSFGLERVPKNITPEVIIGQWLKRQPVRTKKEIKEHVMLKQFSVQGLPKNRIYNLKSFNPMNSSFFNSENSSETLQQWFGYESDEEIGSQISKGLKNGLSKSFEKEGDNQIQLNFDHIRQRSGSVDNVGEYMEKSNSKENDKKDTHIERAGKQCQKLIQINSDYAVLKSQTRNLVTEVDESAAYFDQEILTRLKSTAMLIRQIQKNPAPAKINTIKQALITQNLKKQNQEYKADELFTNEYFENDDDFDDYVYVPGHQKNEQENSFDSDPENQLYNFEPPATKSASLKKGKNQQLFDSQF